MTFKAIMLGWALPLLALAITVFASFYHLSESPAVWYDEGFFEQAAINLETHGAQVMALSPGHNLSSWSISAGYPLIAPMAFLFKYFKTDVFHARLVPVTYLILFVIVAYYFVRREHGLVSATIAAFLLGTFPLLYGNGKSVLGEVPALFYLALMLLSVQWFERTSFTDHRAAFCIGLFAGLSFAAKFTFMLLPLVLVIAIVLRWHTLRSLHHRAWIYSVIGFLAPVFLWAWLQFAPGDTLGQIFGYLFNGYDETGSTHTMLVLQNLFRFVHESTPLYMTIIFAPWVVSLIIRYRERASISIAELMAFLFTLGILIEYLWSPGYYRYFFAAMVVSLIFFPAACTLVWHRLQRALPFLARASWLLCAGFALLILFQSYQLAVNSYVAQYYHSTRTAELTKYFTTLDPTKRVLLYNVPEVGIFMPAQNYSQYLMPHTNQHFGSENLALIQKRVFDLIVINADTYKLASTSFPGYKVADIVAHYDILTP